MRAGASLAGRLLLAAMLVLVAAGGLALARSRASCEDARAAVARAQAAGDGGLASAVAGAEDACPDGGDRLLLVQGLTGDPGSPEARALARDVAARAVRDEPDRYEVRQAVLLAAPDGPQRERAVAALARLDPRLLRR